LLCGATNRPICGQQDEKRPMGDWGDWAIGGQNGKVDEQTTAKKNKRQKN